MSIWIEGSHGMAGDLLRYSSGKLEDGIEASPVSLKKRGSGNMELRVKKIDDSFIQVWFAADVDHAIIAPFALAWLEKKIKGRLN